MLINRQTSVMAMMIILVTQWGCSTFNTTWEATPSEADASPAGCWAGSWRSQVNRHHGPLKCIIQKQSQSGVTAWFKAGYLGVMSFEQTISMDLDQADTGWTFHGSENLGKLAGGLYTYEGTITNETFYSTYSNKWDQGIFEMQKVIKSGTHDRSDQGK
jgi:hypothetical protein